MPNGFSFQEEATKNEIKKLEEEYYGAGNKKGTLDSKTREKIKDLEKQLDKSKGDSDSEMGYYS